MAKVSMKHVIEGLEERLAQFTSVVQQEERIAANAIRRADAHRQAARETLAAIDILRAVEKLPDAPEPTTMATITPLRQS